MNQAANAAAPNYEGLLPIARICLSWHKDLPNLILSIVHRRKTPSARAIPPHLAPCSRFPIFTYSESWIRWETAALGTG